MKVAHVWDEFVFNSFIEVHPLLEKHGFDVKSITIARTLWDNGSAPAENVFFHRKLPHMQLIQVGFWGKAKAYLERRFLRQSFMAFARNVMGSAKSDLVHFHFGFTAAQYPEIALDRPFVVGFYGSDISAALRNSYWVSRYREVLPKASAILVLCEEAKLRLLPLGCAPEKIKIWNLPAGVEKYPFIESRSEAGPPRFITTARFVEKKGHGLLLEAYALLASKGIEFRATLLGYGEGIHWVRREIERLGLGKAVEVVDTQYKGDFASLHYSVLKEQDVFVLPSITAKSGDDEGGPALTMVCAQAAGLPVVCTKFPGSEITMREGATGFFLAEPTSACLALTLEKCIAARSGWKSMGAEGSRLANDNFGEKIQVEKLVRIYSECVNARP